MSTFSKLRSGWGSPGLSARQVAADITKFGGILVALLEALANTDPSFHLPVWFQALDSAVIVILTALQSVLGQLRTSQAVQAASSSKSSAKSS